MLLVTTIQSFEMTLSLKKIQKYFWGFWEYVSEKLDRGMQMDLSQSLICGKSVRDSKPHMNTFSLPYKCRFNLVYFVFSANAQFSHRKHFEHLACTTHVYADTF